jgi:predicted glycoside hydrolase/deacetylase ChbG (UPF0249 family)
LGTLGMAQRPRGVRLVRGIGVYEAGRLNEEALLSVLASLPEGTHELGTHPGLFPGTVPEDPAWRYGWEDELAALSSARAKALIARRSIRLTSYRALSS